MSPATQAKFEPNGHAAPVNGWIDPYSRPWAAELESRADAILVGQLVSDVLDAMLVGTLVDGSHSAP